MSPLSFWPLLVAFASVALVAAISAKADRRRRRAAVARREALERLFDLEEFAESAAATADRHPLGELLTDGSIGPHHGAPSRWRP